MGLSQRWAQLRRTGTYARYSVGCGVAWGVVWVILAFTASDHKLGNVAIFFGGWLVGWTSATIARAVYPPPKRRWWAPPPAGGAHGARR